MGSEAPSWADQWGAGGIGSMAEGDESTKEKDINDKKKGEGKAGLTKAKAAAMMGAQKIKTGASNSFKWVKNKCNKNGSPK